MRMHAKVVCIYEKNSTSRAIAAALRPDNLRIPAGVQISTRQRGDRVITILEIDGKIETLLATLDDLLFCTSTAEGML